MKGTLLAALCVTAAISSYASNINDGYCDSPIADDEPMTSACSMSSFAPPFRCVAEGYPEERIFPSRVHDGICDCCDGSDEAGNKNMKEACPNVCESRYSALREEEARRAVERAAGLSRKAEYVKTAAAELNELRTRVNEARHALPALSEAAQLARTRRSEVEERVDEAKKLEMSAAEASFSQATTALLNAAAAFTRASGKDESTMYRRLIAKVAGAAGRLSTDALVEATTPLLRAAGIDETIDRGQLLQAVRKACDVVHDIHGRDGDDHYDMHGDGDLDEAMYAGEVGMDGEFIDAPQTMHALDGDDDAVTALSTVLKLGDLPGTALPQILMSYAMKTRKTRPLIDGLTPYASVELPLPSLLEDVEAEVSARLKTPTDGESLTQVQQHDEDASAAEAEAQRTVRDADEVLTLPYGDDDAFYALRSRCLSMSEGKYTYNLCFYKHAKQDNTQLGKYTSFKREDDGHGAHQYIMDFDRGERCFVTGSGRTARAIITCGADDAILDVSEPEVCSYHMRVTSPAAC